jgi:hypothetical protein
MMLLVDGDNRVLRKECQNLRGRDARVSSFCNGGLAYEITNIITSQCITYLHLNSMSEIRFKSTS